MPEGEARGSFAAVVRVGTPSMLHKEVRISNCSQATSVTTQTFMVLAAPPLPRPGTSLPPGCPALRPGRPSGLWFLASISQQPGSRHLGKPHLLKESGRCLTDAAASSGVLGASRPGRLWSMCTLHSGLDNKKYGSLAAAVPFSNKAKNECLLPSFEQEMKIPPGSRSNFRNNYSP